MNKSIAEVENRKGVRHFATMRTIERITPIEGKDRIVCTKLEGLGFNVITTSEYKVGDKLIYFETGSLIKEGNPKFEFLREKCYVPLQKGFRVKSVKMFGINSDGLTIPYEKLIDELGGIPFEEGKDVSDLLNVVKYVDDDIEAKGDKFPTHLVSQTDEIRWQNIHKFLTEMNFDFYWRASIKYDGTSTTFILDENNMFWICGRTQTIDCLPLEKAKEIYNPENIKNAKTVYQKFACQASMPKVIENMFKKCDSLPFVIQGELCGKKIQKNKLELKDDNYKYFIFNMKIGGEYKQNDEIKCRVYDTEEYHKSNIQAVKDAFNSIFKITDMGIEEYSPYVDFIKNYSFEEFCLRLNDIKYPGSTKSIEGVVMRPVSDRNYISEYPNFEHNLKSFKVINPEYK